MSKKDSVVAHFQAKHNYIKTQKSNAHTKINGNLVQLWFGKINLPYFPSKDNLEKSSTNKRAILEGISRFYESKLKQESNSVVSKLALIGALTASTLMFPVYADLTITSASNSTDQAVAMAGEILGDGVTINSASYSGGLSQSGTFVTGPGTQFGTDILRFTEEPHWFGEMSYTDMGAATLSSSHPLWEDETISYKVPSLHLGYLLRAPEKQLNFYAKGGVSAIQNSASSTNVPFKKQTNVQTSFGVGTQWQSEDSGLFVRLGADFFDRDAIAAGLNIGYKLGKHNKKESRVIEKPRATSKENLTHVEKVVVMSKPSSVVEVSMKPKPKVVKKLEIKNPVVKRQASKVANKKASFTGVLKGFKITLYRWSDCTKTR